MLSLNPLQLRTSSSAAISLCSVQRSTIAAQPETAMHSIMDVLDNKEDNSSSSSSSNSAGGEVVQANQANTAVFQAVTAGKLEEVRALLPYSATDSSASATPAVSVNVADSAGFTPLIIAARRGYTDIVRYLLAHPSIEVNARTAKGNTALIYAAAKKKVEIVQLLLEGGANFFATNLNQDNVLMCAAISGCEEVFSYLQQAYHNIRTAKLPAGSSATKPWEQGKQAQKRFFALRNEEGLSVLMCAVMGGSQRIVDQTLLEVRRELGIHTAGPEAPSALKQFYPSMWPDVLGDVLHLPQGKMDPSPPQFLAYVAAANIMGDTALHIAAENQNVGMYLSLLENSGADPMRVNRRGKRTFELFRVDSKPAAGASATTVTELNDDGSDVAVPTSSSSSSVVPAGSSIQEVITSRLESILSFQRGLRADFLAAQAKVSEKLFSELMEEEEGGLSGGKKNNKAKGKKSTQQQKKKGVGQSPVVAPVPAPQEAKEASSESDAASDDDSADESHASSSRSAAASASASALPLSASASPVILSPAAPAFVPLAELAAIDAASGWETVTSAKQTKKKDSSAAHPAAAAAAPSVSSSSTAAGAKSKKKADDSALKSPKKKKAANVKTKAKKDAPPAAAVDATAAASAPTAISAPAAAASSPATAFTLPPTARTRAWRPIVSLNRKESPDARPTGVAASAPLTQAFPPSSPLASASSSSSSTSASVQSLFSSLHPHIESTDLQLEHFLGAGWSSLSMSQLSCLDEIYSSLARQIREAQFGIFQQQQQELMADLVRTKSEVHQLRKEVRNGKDDA